MSEYVDVLSEKWTKRYKIYKIIMLVVRIVIIAMFCWMLLYMFDILAPYIEDPEMELENAFTNSQLTAMIILIVLAWGVKFICDRVSRM